MKYSVAIIGHPSRTLQVWALVDKLTADKPDLRLKVFMDVDSQGLKYNVMRAIRDETFPDDEYKILIQDDMLPCRDFCKSVELAYSVLRRYRGATAIPCFYSYSKLVQAGLNQNVSWVKNGPQAWTCCWVAPVGILRDYAQWVDAPETRRAFSDVAYHFEDGPLFLDDFTFSKYVRVHKLPVYLSVPSLIQHGGHGKSLLGHTGDVPTPWFIGEERSALRVNWELGL